MKKTLYISLFALSFSCTDKTSKNLLPDEKMKVSKIDKQDSQTEKVVKNDSLAKPKPPVAIPPDVEKVTLEPIKCFPPKSVECKDKGGNMENGFVTVCTYKNQNLSEAYNDYREKNKDNDDGKFLAKEMPSGKHQDSFNDESISVTYMYPKQNHLKIEILFPGGVTTIDFNVRKDDVAIKTTHSPD